MSELNDTNKGLDYICEIMSASQELHKQSIVHLLALLELQKQTNVHIQEMKEIQQKQLQQYENNAERNYGRVDEEGDFEIVARRCSDNN